MNDIAGKVMGIQSYGRLDYEFLDFIKRFDIHTLRELYDIDVWRKFKGDNKVAELQPLDWIHTVHTRTGELLLEFFQRYAKPTDIITYSGGVAQNVIWNTLLKNHFPNLIIPPHSSDEGLSLGGIEYFRHKYNLNKPSIENFPYCQTDIAPFENPSVEVINFVAEKLVEGKIIGWYQGNGEVGPRALGNRSILMDPRIPNGKDMINKIKRRENYRPFGASVLQEHKNILFESYHDDEFMLYSSKVKVDWLKAITHVDNTCRVQTVNKSSHPFRILLERFYELSECPVLLNTSLNMAGKPIAGYPENALSVFKGSNMDILVIGNDVFQKT
jgi:carbamoyltransferase